VIRQATIVNPTSRIIVTHPKNRAQFKKRIKQRSVFRLNFVTALALPNNLRMLRPSLLKPSAPKIDGIN
jgi:hypothetical protein